MRKIALVYLLLALSSHSMAYTTTTPTQYSGLQWTVSGSTGFEPYAYCSSMTLNGLASLNDNSTISFFGTLNCNSNANAYVVSGTGYLNVNGGLSFGLTVGGSTFWNCATNSALNATCKVSNNSGALIAAPNITFR